MCVSACTEQRPVADGQVVWFRYPDAGIQRNVRKRVVADATKLCFARTWWPTSPAHQEEYEAAVKTIAQGGPGCLGRTCGTCRLHFFLQAGHGGGELPAFPAPSDLRGERPASLGQHLPREGERVF